METQAVLGTPLGADADAALLPFSTSITNSRCSRSRGSRFGWYVDTFTPHASAAQLRSRVLSHSPPHHHAQLLLLLYYILHTTPLPSACNSCTVLCLQRTVPHMTHPPNS